MEFRHEVKHEINYSDMLTIRHRLGAVAYPDPHAVDGKYFIRSLYFDNLADKALMEKVKGMSRREKFRIRYYNGDTSVIHLDTNDDRRGETMSKAVKENIEFFRGTEHICRNGGIIAAAKSLRNKTAPFK